jgi:hypothetical protein
MVGEPSKSFFATAADGKASDLSPQEDAIEW